MHKQLFTHEFLYGRQPYKWMAGCMLCRQLTYSSCQYNPSFFCLEVINDSDITIISLESRIKRQTAHWSRIVCMVGLLVSWKRQGESFLFTWFQTRMLASGFICVSFFCHILPFSMPGLYEDSISCFPGQTGSALALGAMYYSIGPQETYLLEL